MKGASSMHVSVNGVRLFFDVEGTKLVPDGHLMREKPTLLLLHGGPGADHSIYRPAYSALSDIAQIVYLDHRGNGRSEDGPRERWTLAQWGDDVRAFCDALGIVDPIVLGASFGGMVAMSYATRHPDHPSKLVLISTEAVGGSYPERRVELFERFGGSDVGALARRRFLEVRGQPDQTWLDQWRRLAMPHYTRIPRDPDALRRAVSRGEVLRWFSKPGGESQSFNMLARLGCIRCPTLVLGGEDDPIHPIESQADIAAALPPHLVQFERFRDCRHAVIPDAPEQAFAVIRDFIMRSK
jgi:pimeloyl-ACP methyl ester carboxylesterase